MKEYCLNFSYTQRAPARGSNASGYYSKATVQAATKAILQSHCLIDLILIFCVKKKDSYFWSTRAQVQGSAQGLFQETC